MIKITIKILTWLLISPLFLNAQVPWSTGQSRGQDLQIKLVTFGVGDDIPSYWGHTALIVEDTLLKQSKIYNFGLYSFDQKFILRFVTGRLIFSAGTSSVSFYLNYYSSINRDVRIATLNLSPEKSLQLAEELAVAVLPENKDYLYDHYFENCSTRQRDLIDRAVDGQLKKASSVPARMTLRDHTSRYVSRNPALEMLLVFLMNDEIDQPLQEWDEMFLPDELERDILKLEYIDGKGKRQRLVNDYFMYYEADRLPLPKEVPAHWKGALIVGFALAILALLFVYYYRKTKNEWLRIAFGMYNFLIGLVLGIPGLLLGLLSAFTHHTVSYYNENLLLANPLTILFIPLGVLISRNEQHWAKWLRRLWYLHALGVVLAIALKALPAFDQNNWLVLAFFAPVSIGTGLVCLYGFKDK